MLRPTGGSLLRRGPLVVLVLLHARGFRPVLARDWHGGFGQSVWELACHARSDRESAGQRPLGSWPLLTDLHRRSPFDRARGAGRQWFTTVAMTRTMVAMTNVAVTATSPQVAAISLEENRSDDCIAITDDQISRSLSSRLCKRWSLKPFLVDSESASISDFASTLNSGKLSKPGSVRDGLVDPPQIRCDLRKPCPSRPFRPGFGRASDPAAVSTSGLRPMRRRNDRRFPRPLPVPPQLLDLSQVSWRTCAADQPTDHMRPDIGLASASYRQGSRTHREARGFGPW